MSIVIMVAKFAAVKSWVNSISILTSRLYFQKLAGAPTLSLDKAIEIARTNELSIAQLKSMKPSSGVVHAIIKGHQYKRNSWKTP